MTTVPFTVVPTLPPSTPEVVCWLLDPPPPPQEASITTQVNHDKARILRDRPAIFPIDRIERTMRTSRALRRSGGRDEHGACPARGSQTSRNTAVVPRASP
jgi:hypothetical protein